MKYALVQGPPYLRFAANLSAYVVIVILDYFLFRLNQRIISIDNNVRRVLELMLIRIVLRHLQIYLGINLYKCTMYYMYSYSP